MFKMIGGALAMIKVMGGAFVMFQGDGRGWGTSVMFMVLVVSHVQGDG